LVVSSDSAPSVKTIRGLAAASVHRGHDVAIFFNAEGARLLSVARNDENLADLASRKVRLLACRTSARECGIESEGQLLKGAEMSSLSGLVELLERSDRVVFMG